MFHAVDPVPHLTSLLTAQQLNLDFDSIIYAFIFRVSSLYKKLTGYTAYIVCVQSTSLVSSTFWHEVLQPKQT